MEGLHSSDASVVDSFVVQDPEARERKNSAGPTLGARLHGVAELGPVEQRLIEVRILTVHEEVVD